MPHRLLLGLPCLLVACSGSEPGASPAPRASTQPAATLTATASPPAHTAAPTASATASAATSAAASPAQPTSDEWKTAKDARVAGSTALGCDTKRVREWLRVSCEKPNDTNGTPTKVKVIKAELIRPGVPIVQTRREVILESSAGRTSLVTRYIEGTDVEATFTWTDKEKHLSLFWPGGKPEPLYTGGFK